MKSFWGLIVALTALAGIVLWGSGTLAKVWAAIVSNAKPTNGNGLASSSGQPAMNSASSGGWGSATSAKPTAQANVPTPTTANIIPGSTSVPKISTNASYSLGSPILNNLEQAFNTTPLPSTFAEPTFRSSVVGNQPFTQAPAFFNNGQLNFGPSSEESWAAYPEAPEQYPSLIQTSEISSSPWLNPVGYGTGEVSFDEPQPYSLDNDDSEYVVPSVPAIMPSVYGGS